MFSLLITSCNDKEVYIPASRKPLESCPTQPKVKQEDLARIFRNLMGEDSKIEIKTIRASDLKENIEYGSANHSYNLDQENVLILVTDIDYYHNNFTLYLTKDPQKGKAFMIKSLVDRRGTYFYVSGNGKNLRWAHDDIGIPPGRFLPKGMYQVSPGELLMLIFDGKDWICNRVLEGVLGMYDSVDTLPGD